MREAARQAWMFLVTDRVRGWRYMRELKRQIAEVERGEREEITVEFPGFRP
jgi:hypothetical protein